MGGRPSIAIAGTGRRGLGAAIRPLHAAFAHLTAFERADDAGGVRRDGPRTHLGMAIVGLPNFLLMYGPNINVGSGSVVHMLESQIAYIVQATRALRDPEVPYMDVREGVFSDHDDQVRCRRAGDRPGSMFGHRRRTRALDPSGHRFVVR